eukprot:COSAG01_NODE_10335_length_2191_cov_1.579828_1_plen_175_part_00
MGTQLRTKLRKKVVSDGDISKTLAGVFADRFPGRPRKLATAQVGREGLKAGLKHVGHDLAAWHPEPADRADQIAEQMWEAIAPPVRGELSRSPSGVLRVSSSRNLMEVEPSAGVDVLTQRLRELLLAPPSHRHTQGRAGQPQQPPPPPQPQLFRWWKGSGGEPAVSILESVHID